MKSFSIKDAIRYGFYVTRTNLAFFIPLLLIFAVLDNLSGATGQYIHSNPLASVILFIIFWLIEMIANLGFIKISLKFVDKKKPSFSDLFSESELVFRFVGATLLYCLMVAGGLILLIVPGIILAIRFGYYKYVLVDEKVGVIESLKRSSQITQGNRLKLFWLTLTFVGINLLGLLAVLIGLFVSIPTTVIASASVYRKLSKKRT